MTKGTRVSETSPRKRGSKFSLSAIKDKSVKFKLTLQDGGSLRGIWRGRLNIYVGIKRDKRRRIFGLGAARVTTGIVYHVKII